MVKELNFIAYRKLKAIKINFSPFVNVIAGTNGTCKSSILHLVSNSYRKVQTTADYIREPNAIKVISKINKILNPKIEGLTRGDKSYNNPAPRVPGTLYSCLYDNDYQLNFRRHNAADNKRFAIKPEYKVGRNDYLPMMPIIYLGLFRLFSFGEFSNDNLIKSVTRKLPDQIKEELQILYKNFTGYDIALEKLNAMGEIKNRAEFETDIQGVDSNTISAGEDNLFIILLSLVSLKYYFESIISNQEIESILLIDEIDATLHPAFQLKLLELCLEYSRRYKIQVIFTSHSLTLLEKCLLEKDVNVVYLLDNIDYVLQMEDVDIYKIKMFLNQALENEVYIGNKIPIITEDDEAREFLQLLLERYAEKNNDSIEKYFHLVQAKLSSSAIKNLAQDKLLSRSTLRTINILDGDMQNNLNDNIITLPGSTSPEEIAFTYSKILYEDPKYNKFWENQVLLNVGFTKTYYRDHLLSKYESNLETLEELQEANKSHGKKRDLNKKLFNSYSHFWLQVLHFWIRDENNSVAVEEFYQNLFKLFKKTAEFHDIDSKQWNLGVKNDS
ncbi:AAA family ATPase [Streptococcus mutans]|uniref:AAA family ATPase n=1 Tax=Streptococcus mutans TaxID=1309 RepID=UPI000268A6B1|nr:AAA family ATPase [Streptococcus mutans]AFM80577.1 putative prophage Lp2 protein 4 [Streptococcus mutans GS-5]